jgi:lipoprotein-anchoring transpeptidase ErfK/SrfK
MLRPTIFAALAIGCALPASQVLAQYYPADVYRGAPAIDPDDDPRYADPPGDYRFMPRSPGSRVERGPYEQPLYPAERYGRAGPSPYADAYPDSVPRPPVGIYPEERQAPRTYASPPGYDRPDEPGYPPHRPPRPGYGMQPGYGPPPAYGPPPGYGQPPGYGAQPAQPGYGTQQGYAQPPASIDPSGTTRTPPAVGRDARYAALPPDYQPEEGDVKELPGHLKRQLVDYPTKQPAGTVIIDTARTSLYFVLGNGKAVRYGIGVGREGFTWAGEERISRMAEWPDWHPPAEMIERQPYLPRFMAGGAANPLGARALYLGKTIYRIHGTNQPSTIGQFVSSGCIRLLNEDIEDLYGRVNVGTRVVVLPGRPPATAAR